MKTRHKTILISILLAVLVIPTLVGAATAAPAEPEGYEINWWKVAGGGGESSSGGYTLKGTIGQHDAGSLQGGDYSLGGGFWVKGIQVIVDFIIHLPLILK